MIDNNDNDTDLWNYVTKTTKKISSNNSLKHHKNIPNKRKQRVILTPEHAKRFKKAMEENIQRFEKANGTIKANDTPNIPLNFGPTGEA